MMTAIGAILGFFSSIVPDIFKIFQDRSDRIHELRLLDMQLQSSQQGHVHKLEEVNAHADISETKAIYKTFYSGIGWVDALNGTVRPVLAYAFFIFYAFVKVAIIISMIMHDVPLVFVSEAIEGGLPWQQIATIKANPYIWTDSDNALLGAIIAFFFGQRAMQKIRQGK